MAQTALQRLEDAINIEYYIGKKEADKIRKACQSTTKTASKPATPKTEK